MGKNWYINLNSNFINKKIKTQNKDKKIEVIFFNLKWNLLSSHLLSLKIFSHRTTSISSTQFLNNFVNFMILSHK